MVMPCQKVNRRLLPIKFHYFLFWTALACALPFRTVFAKHLGISATALGVIYLVIPFIKIATNPLFGFLLDYFKRFRLTLSVIMLLVSLCHVVMVFIPPRTLKSVIRTNITGDDFQLKVSYLCLNDNGLSFCDPTFLIHNEYRVSHDPTISKSKITCDVKCSSSRNRSISNAGRQCREKMNFEFNYLVSNISSCDTDIKMQSGQLKVFSEDDSVVVALNITRTTDLKSWILSPNNCSVELEKRITFLPMSVRQRFAIGNQSGEDTLETYVANDVHNALQENLDLNSGRYFALSEYPVLQLKTLLGEKNHVASSCGLEFACQTKECFFNPEQITAKESEYLSVQFWSLFMLIEVSSVALSVVIFLTDTICYELLQDRQEKYGQQRFWGTLGWGTGALVGGYINEIFTSESGEIDYTFSFCLSGVLAVIDLTAMCQLKVKDLKYSSNIWKDVCCLFTKMNIVYNILIVYFIGIFSGFIWHYQFWFMEEIGSSQVLLGLSQTFEAMFEIPCFIVSGWIIRTFGHDHCNSITLLCLALRYLSFFFMYDPWWMLASAILHGPTFGLFYASLTMHAKKIAPPGTEATVQSLLCLFFEGIGVATGSILGGMGLDYFGSRKSFLYAAVLNFMVLFINILMSIYLKKSTKNTKQNNKTVSIILSPSRNQLSTF